MPDRRVDQDNLEEFSRLVQSAGTLPVASQRYRIRALRAATCLGQGVVEEIRGLVLQTKAQVVYVNHVLTPIQQRNLERIWGVRVVDRPALILDIFALRATSYEGKLQIELAKLQHQATRLVRGWTHLERQKGGIGLRGGPGETQLELDRRQILQKVSRLRQRLAQLKSRRAIRRRHRHKQGVFQVSLVGYTNAGKSTLFNALTHAKVYAADLLFATLDPVVRKIYLAPSCEVVLTDTVGFIRDLPHVLIEAFQATLEETVQADLLLHIVDGAAANVNDQIHSVNQVLAEVGAGEVPQIMVWNKCDITDTPSGIERDGYGKIRAVLCSAASGAGLEGVRLALLEALRNQAQVEHQHTSNAESADVVSSDFLAETIAEHEIEKVRENFGLPTNALPPATVKLGATRLSSEPVVD